MTQIAETTDTSNAEPRPNLTIEIVKRNVKRVLPCKLSDEELLRIARMRTAKENEHDQLVAEADLDAKKRKAQIKEYADEILSMRRELHSGYQDRTILTNEVFEKDAQGNCWIVVYRMDTGEPTKERWPASPAEMQRHLPMDEAGSGGGLLAQAAKVQRSAQDAPAESGVPEGLPSGDDVPDGDESDAGGDDAGEGKPKRSGKKAKS